MKGNVSERIYNKTTHVLRHQGDRWIEVLHFVVKDYSQGMDGGGRGRGVKRRQEGQAIQSFLEGGLDGAAAWTLLPETGNMVRQRNGGTNNNILKA